VSSRLGRPSTEQIAAAEKELAQLEAKYGEIAADVGLAGASMLPPPFGTAADVVSIGKSLLTGDWGGALLDVVGVVPVLGDAAKAAGKGGKLLKAAEALETGIKATKAKLAHLKDGLMAARKTEAARYWDEITSAGRKQYDEAIANCTTQACRDRVPITTKGEHYALTPKGGDGRGDWIDGTRGDGHWTPAPDTPLGKQLQSFSNNPALNPGGKQLDAIPYRNGFPDYDDFVVPARPGRKAQVEILQTRDSKIDFESADDALLASTGKTRGMLEDELGTRLTWHHKEDGTTMQLLPRGVHGGSNQSGHAGGSSLMRDPEF
jgi:hypothetical protein